MPSSQSLDPLKRRQLDSHTRRAESSLISLFDNAVCVFEVAIPPADLMRETQCARNSLSFRFAL